MNWNVLKGLVLITLAYAGVIIGCCFLYTWKGMESRRAFHYSIDTITCRGRVDDNAELEIVRTLAAMESILGHFAVPAAIGIMFSAGLVGIGSHAGSDPPDYP